MAELSEKLWKRLIFRWTAPKGFVAIMLFLLLALLFEYLLVYSFQSFGLVDNSAWVQTLNVPSTNWSFTLSLSPMFHFLPLAVIVVLTCSWMYLTKHTAFVPRRIETPKKLLPSRREPERLRFRRLRRFFKRVGRRLQKFGQAFKAALYRIRGVSYLSKRLFFARVAVKSALTIIGIFLSASLLFCVAVYPRLPYDAIIGFYRGNPSFLGLILKIAETAGAIGQTLSPIGWLASSLNNALLAAAPGFRRALEGAGAAVIGPLARLNIVEKYVVVQNAAAWISAFTALAYGEYTFRFYRRTKTR